MLVSAYYMLDRDEPYRELGVEWFDQRHADAHTRRLVVQLKALGHTVALDLPGYARCCRLPRKGHSRVSGAIRCRSLTLGLAGRNWHQARVPKVDWLARVVLTLGWFVAGWCVALLITLGLGS